MSGSHNGLEPARGALSGIALGVLLWVALGLVLHALGWL